jgi:hypothetical protein
MRTAIAAALLAATLPLPSLAELSVASFDLQSARNLVDLCAVADDHPMAEAARGFCYGYLSGAGHYHRAVKAGADAQPLFCLPDRKLSRTEAAQLYVDWGRSHPEHLDEAPIDNLMRFAVATWPCPQTPR